MQLVSDFTALDDPQFIQERRRVREQLERLPAGNAEHARLASLYNAMTQELDRRAASAWRQAAYPEDTEAGNP